MTYRPSCQARSPGCRSSTFELVDAILDFAQQPLPGTQQVDGFIDQFLLTCEVPAFDFFADEILVFGRDLTVTLGGRYYEFRTESTTGDRELQVMTYDAEAKLYRQWVFSSDGYSHAAQGTWDHDTSTLRWTGTADGTTFTIDDRFVEPGRLEWTLQRFNDDGQAVQGIRGTLTRIAE